RCGTARRPGRAAAKTADRDDLRLAGRDLLIVSSQFPYLNSLVAKYPKISPGGRVRNQSQLANRRARRQFVLSYARIATVKETAGMDVFRYRDDRDSLRSNVAQFTS